MRKTKSYLSKAILLGLFFYLCTNCKSEAEKRWDKTMGNMGKSECQIYLEDYETFANSYVEIIKKFANDPKDSSVRDEYKKMMDEAKDWVTKKPDCDGKEAEFTEKLAEIQLKIAKELESSK